MVDQKERKTRRRTKKPAAKPTPIEEAQAAARAKQQKQPEQNTLSAMTPLAATRPLPNKQKAQASGRPADRMLPSAGNRNPQVPTTIPGLTDIADSIGQRAKDLAAQKKQDALANPDLYGGGGVFTASASIKARLDAQRAAINAARSSLLAKQGSAVYMGPQETNPREAARGRGEGEFEGGQASTPKSITVDKVVDKNSLMAWLSDETIVGQLKRRMNAAGIDVQSYDDIAKLWKSVIDQAAATYSVTGKKITPWAILELRGKFMKGGKPAAKTTTSTTVHDIDPAQARMMFENAAQQFLGRQATNAEIDDFIAKAQTIARNHPEITRTTTQYGFDGSPTSEFSRVSGGAAATDAELQSAAMDMAQHNPDYAKVQAAGTIFPWLVDALGPAVG